jgi:hypothetical protein
MSVRVISEVFQHSKSVLAARLVLLVLADAAHDDGVTWVSQEEIAAKTLAVDSTVRRVINDLVEAGEIEVRKAQRGRRRINVYRVTFADVEPDYDALPFTLNEPFSTAADIERSAQVDDRRSCALTTADPASREDGAKLLNRKLNHKEKKAPIVPHTNGKPAKVDHHPVTDHEWQLTTRIVEAFNNVADTRFTPPAWARPIIMRLREHPELDLPEHEHVIDRALQDPWWKGPASPSVIYGNAALFERCIAAKSAPIRNVRDEDIEPILRADRRARGLE